MVLHKVQQEQSYISREAADKVAALLDVPLATIWGVISVSLFQANKAQVSHNIQVCLGTACYLKGAQPLVDELNKLLAIDIGGVTDDGLFLWKLSVVLVVAARPGSHRWWGSIRQGH